MNKRRTIMVAALLTAVVLITILALKWINTKPSEENDEVASKMDVHIGAITRATLHRFVTAYGTVEPELGPTPANAEVASPVAGIIARNNCVEGQKVTRGAIFFYLDSRVADVAYEKAKKALDFATASFERQKQLLAVEGTSQKNYQEAEQLFNAARSELAAAETDLELLRIKAPLTGTLVKVNGKPGDAVELNTVLAKIVNLDRLIAAINVPSREAGLLRVGQPARFENGIEGIVTFIGSHIDNQSDTVLVRLSIPVGAGFKPGQFVSVHIVCEERGNCLAVPENAAIPEAAGSTVGTIVMVAGDQAVRRTVKLGLREAGLVEVSGTGLQEGQTIVCEDAYAVPDGMKIHIIK